jgi:hypothetical protein
MEDGRRKTEDARRKCKTEDARRKMQDGKSKINKEQRSEIKKAVG